MATVARERRVRYQEELDAGPVMALVVTFAFLVIAVLAFLIYLVGTGTVMDEPLPTVIDYNRVESTADSRHQAAPPGDGQRLQRRHLRQVF